MGVRAFRERPEDYVLEFEPEATTSVQRLFFKHHILVNFKPRKRLRQKWLLPKTRHPDTRRATWCIQPGAGGIAQIRMWDRFWELLRPWLGSRWTPQGQRPIFQRQHSELHRSRQAVWKSQKSNRRGGLGHKLLGTYKTQIFQHHWHLSAGYPDDLHVKDMLVDFFFVLSNNSFLHLEIYQSSCFFEDILPFIFFKFFGLLRWRESIHYNCPLIISVNLAIVLHLEV